MTWEAGAEALPSCLLAGLLMSSNLSLFCKAAGAGEGKASRRARELPELSGTEKGRNPELPLCSGCFPRPPTCRLYVSGCQSSLLLSPAPRLGEV